MTKEEIVRFAKESGWQVDPEGNIFDADGWHTCTDEVERFAALVIAAERQRKAWDAKYWTAYEQDVAAAERESCAKMLAEEGWLMAATLVRVKK
jgi:hypothetical protein